MVAEQLAVIRGDDHIRVLQKPPVLQLVEQPLRNYPKTRVVVI
jgi:hypothetical protein